MESAPYLQTWRLYNGLTQKELGKGSGLTQAQISYLENRTHAPTLETLNKLARTLGIGVGELMQPPASSYPSLSRQEVSILWGGKGCSPILAHPATNHKAGL